MQLFLIIFGIIIVLLFAEPIFEDVFNIATVAGIGAGIFPTVLGLLWNRANDTVKCVLAVLYFAGIALLLCLMLIIFAKGKTNAAGQRAIIVLGCSVKGSRPSLSLIHRVDAAYNFLVKNPKAFAILSGGQGPDEDLSEAQCMYNMLTEKGISPSRLFKEDKSTNTDENIKFSLEIIKSLGLGSEIAVATSEYHQLRAKMICKRYGLTAYAQSSKTKLIILPTFLLREIPAIVKEKLCH